MGLISLLETVGSFCSRVRGLGYLPTSFHPSLAEGGSWVHSLALPGCLCMGRRDESSQRDIGSHVDALR